LRFGKLFNVNWHLRVGAANWKQERKRREDTVLTSGLSGRKK
jgi:hypothetical protein